MYCQSLCRYLQVFSLVKPILCPWEDFWENKRLCGKHRPSVQNTGHERYFVIARYCLLWLLRLLRNIALIETLLPEIDEDISIAIIVKTEAGCRTDGDDYWFVVAPEDIIEEGRLSD